MQPSSSKSKMVSSNSTEVKLIERGGCYLTLFKPHHIEEFARVISAANTRELQILGYTDVRHALMEMNETADAYVVRRESGDIISVCGLFYHREGPQMFAMFSEDFTENYTTLARGSKMLVSFFDQQTKNMSMTILAEHTDIINWACWLGFEPVGTSTHGSHEYIEFVRCNPSSRNVYDDSLRPAMH